jgi:hypothetical protein
MDSDWVTREDDWAVREPTGPETEEGTSLAGEVPPDGGEDQGDGEEETDSSS